MAVVLTFRKSRRGGDVVAEVLMVLEAYRAVDSVLVRGEIRNNSPEALRIRELTVEGGDCVWSPLLINERRLTIPSWGTATVSGICRVPDPEPGKVTVVLQGVLIPSRVPVRARKELEVVKE